MVQKKFSLEEANSLIPKISSLFESVFELNKNAKALSKDVDNLIDIWGKEIFNKTHPDHQDYKNRMLKRDGVLEKIQEHINEITGFGCLVKSVDQGLIDFLYDNNGDLVYLCWKYGEAEIDHWHGASEGFIGRKKIKTLLENPV